MVVSTALTGGWLLLDSHPEKKEENEVSIIFTSMKKNKKNNHKYAMLKYAVFIVRIF